MKSVKELHEELKSGALTIEALIEASKKTIAEKDGEVHALLGLYSDQTVQTQIEKAKQMFKDGTATMLTGVPFVLKDNLLVKGETATGGSKILENYKAVYDATAVKKLKEAGAILIGRANLDEFAMGSSTENSAFGVTRNPHDTSRVAGGSSGGSAAAVAYGAVPVALGSDTGGSIRQPAAFCGVVGLKTTYGAVSRYGVMAMGSSLDQIGPFGTCVDDVEAVFNVIAGNDPLDSTSLPESAQVFTKENKKVIGVPNSFINNGGVNEEVLANFNASLEKLKSAGYTIKDISIDHLDKALAVYYIIMFAEVSSNLARYDGIRYGLSLPGDTSIRGYFESRTAGFGAEVRRRILLGTYVLSSGYYDAYYNKAQLVRDMLIEEFNRVFKEVDVIAMPTTPSTAFKVGEKVSDPLAMYLEDIFTVPVNIVGVPAISIPSGKDGAGLPFGLQFLAPHNGEKVLFTIGRDFEKVYLGM
jgi:aspartyl-tRNA(Asn)/glutamyl-tRNA(Gln) amidotransferase subunit A